MALYQNGILISGANTLPQMTLAEYQALPVSERPTYWERTDLSYNNIPASNVTYGSGSVEDAINEINAKAIHYEDVEVRCSDVTWTASTFGKYYYLAKPVAQISGTVIATSIVGWSSLRTSDNIQAIYDDDGAMLLSNTDSFASPNTRVTVRIVTVGA